MAGWGGNCVIKIIDRQASYDGVKQGSTLIFFFAPLDVQCCELVILPHRHCFDLLCCVQDVVQSKHTFRMWLVAYADFFVFIGRLQCKH